MPIDPAYPAERIALMLEDSQIKVLLTEQHLLGGAAGKQRAGPDPGHDDGCGMGDDLR